MDKEHIKTLIMLYEQHPCLYVTKSVDYHNRNKRDQALQAISRHYQEITNQPITVDAIKKKINNLRSQYLDQVNKIRQSKVSGASTDEVYKPTWWLFHDLSFLSAHIATRPGESSLIDSKSQSDASDTSVISLINDSSLKELQYTDVCDLVNKKTADCNNRRSPTPSVSNSSKSSRTGRDQKKETLTEISSARLGFWKAASQTLMNISNDDENIQDGIRHWILYLESELRKVKNKKRLKRLQRKILELVDEEDE